jgi:nucleoside-diphosphate-sugar epimerase
MKRERVLVTGGAGFIGSHLVERLLKEGYAVRVLDNFSTGKRSNLSSMLSDIELVEADLRDEDAVERTVKGTDFILHQAALGSVPRSIDDPLTTHECNSTGTLKLLIAARSAGVRRVVYASSSSVYGNTPTLPKVETMATSPLSPYALSKLTGEIYCRLFTSLYGLETVSLRYFNVFGPRQDEKSQYAAVIPRFSAALLNGTRPVVFGDGEQTRDFTYVENVVEANLLAMTGLADAAGEAFNVACGERYSLRQLALELSRALNLPLELEYTDPRPGDVRDSYADISKATKLLGYHPNIGFREGIAETARWFEASFKNHKDTKSRKNSR